MKLLLNDLPRLLLLCLGLLGQAAPAAPKFEDNIAQRALACTACHGEQGRAAADGYYPRLAGKPQGYLYRQLLNFRDGRRHYGLMTDLIDPLSDAYLNELAGYFAGLHLPYPAPQLSTMPKPDLERGRQLVFNGDPMAQIARQLTEDEINSISQWLAAQAMPADTRPAADLPATPPVRCGSLQ